MKIPNSKTHIMHYYHDLQSRVPIFLSIVEAYTKSYSADKTDYLSNQTWAKCCHSEKKSQMADPLFILTVWETKARTFVSVPMKWENKKIDGSDNSELENDNIRNFLLREKVYRIYNHQCPINPFSTAASSGHSVLWERQSVGVF